MWTWMENMINYIEVYEVCLNISILYEVWTCIGILYK
jgi:hypothetical protein